MKQWKPEILFKLLWIGLTLFTIYIFGWLTFVYLTFGNLFKEKYEIWNLLLPNILTIGLLIFYTKELLIGNNPESKNRNLKSLLIFSTLITILTFIQIPQFELLLTDLKSEYWQVMISLIIVLTSYVGIIANRILKLIKPKNKKRK
ncbi:hypothetical protein P8625_07145 [Tenacibaculum tangerinum]|uniref:Uncharacterized protein n=1 Tax=Tenacibaculum tangerinum TaxID=3038772 RepID=A0ABY8L6L1_9FLAO|nr:hypothetical protein [Tenacibaculum tangerinum]WGH76911.1 hypothetical protein P8625_07145 [Tenacibaculum tangerinum]